MHRSFRRGLVKLGWATLTFFVLAIGLAQAATTYVYDANGRLRAVTNSAGASAEYVYDAMGNLLHVDSVAAGKLKIFAFSPDHGAIGATVTISGQGFSATATSDTVKFNGVAATVTQATATSLTTSVPAGATTGTITVTVGTNTATSDDVFTVDTTGLAPVITSFSPSIGGAGTVVTVLGKNLDPVANQSYPAIDGTKSTPTSASATQVVFPVTPVMGSGKVSVTTPYGMGLSSADFFVTPPGISAANVAIKTRVVVGGSVPLSIPAGKYAAVLFDASAGSYLSFQASNIVNSANAISYTIYDGHNHPMLDGTLSTSNPSIHLPMLPVTGTYSIWLSSSAAANLTLALQADQALSLNKVLTTSTSGPDQTERLFFNATAGQTLGLQLASQTTSPAGAYVQYTVYAPNGVQVTSFNTTTPTFADLPHLLATGTYTVIVSPNVPAKVTSQLQLVGGVAANVAINGAPLNFATKWKGQSVYLTFTAMAGENVGIGINNLVASPDSYAYVYVYDAEGNYINSAGCSVSSGGCGLDLQKLAGGQYQLNIYPQNDGDTMSFTVTATQDATGTLPMNTKESESLARRGQTGSYTFSATAGQTLALVVGAPTTVPSGNYVSYYLYAPNGSQYDSQYSANGFTWNLPSLSQSGTYKLYVQPNYGATLSQSLELVSGVTGTVAVNGPSANFKTTVSGQSVYLTFTATAGENVGIGISNMAQSPDQDWIRVEIYDSNSDYINETGCYPSNGSCGLDLQNLSGGTYQIIVEPEGNSDTMSFTMIATQDATGTLPMNEMETVSLARYGQTGTYTFNATAGQTLALELGTATTMPSGTYMYYYLYTPDGNQYDSNYTDGDGFTWNLPNLPQSGTYELYMWPNYGATLNQSVKLVPGVTGTMAVNGPSANFKTTVPGENVYLTFTATAGESVGVGISNLTVTPDAYAEIEAYDFNGNYIASTQCYNGSCGLDLQSLAAGQYQLIAHPLSNDTLSFMVTATQDATDTLPMNEMETVSLARYGQTGTYTFNATAGQTLALELGAATTVPSGTYVDYSLYTPNGNRYDSNYTDGGGFTWNLPNLPQSGAYELYVQPRYGATLSQSMKLVSGVTGTVTVNGSAENFATTVQGENVYLAFTVTAGENVGIGISNLTVNPDQYVYLNVYDANGNYIKETYCDVGGGSCELDLQNLAGGQYQLILEPWGNATMSFTVAATQQ